MSRDLNRDNPPPGQQTLPGMAEVMGYETVTLKPDQERFVWAWVRNGGNATDAYQEIFKEQDRTKARKNASKLATNRDIIERKAQVQEEIGNIWKRKIRDYHGRSLEFDIAEAFARNGEKIEARDLPEDLRRLCTLEARIVDGSLRYIPVFPDKFKSAQELAKMMGVYSAEKREIEHSGEMVVTEIVRRIVRDGNPGN